MKYPASLMTIGFMLTALAPGLSHACDAPEEPTIPNIETTVTAEMVKAQNDIKQYMADAKAYLGCVKSQSKHNRMVTKMESIAEDFNKVVREFKKKNSKA